jgi:hypothetical protein
MVVRATGGLVPSAAWGPRLQRHNAANGNGTTRETCSTTPKIGIAARKTRLEVAAGSTAIALHVRTAIGTGGGSVRYYRKERRRS